MGNRVYLELKLKKEKEIGRRALAALDDVDKDLKKKKAATRKTEHVMSMIEAFSEREKLVSGQEQDTLDVQNY